MSATAAVVPPSLNKPGGEASGTLADHPGESSMATVPSATAALTTLASRLAFLAPEVLGRILVHVGRQALGDLAALAKTCSQLRDLVYSDSDVALWRELHNDLYDDPRRNVHRPRIGPFRFPATPGGDSVNNLDLAAKTDIDWRGECIARWRVRRRLALASQEAAGSRPLKRKMRDGEVGDMATKKAVDAGSEEAEGLGLGDMLADTVSPGRARANDAEIEVDTDEADEIAQVLLAMYNAMPTASSSSTSLNAAHLIRLINSLAFEQMYRKSFRRDSRYSLRATRGRLSGRLPGRSNRMDMPHAGLAHLHALLGWGEESFRRDNFAPPEVDPEFGLIYDKDHLSSDIIDGRVPASAAERIVIRRARYQQNLGQHRQIAYSIAHYNERNDFGPLRPDGTVNWPVLDAIAAVMDANVSYVSGRSAAFRGRHAQGWEVDEWRRVAFPDRNGLQAVRATALLATSSRKRTTRGDVEDEDEDESQQDTPVHDWAGIEGTWRGTYAFMDYTDWIQFNYSDMNILDRRRAVNITDYTEAIGQAMRMQLTTTMSEFASRLDKIQSTIPTSTVLPPIDFCGVSTGGTSVEGSHIRGTVSLTTDDPPEVRWTWVVRYSGFDRWRLEGIQVGGCKSRRGIVGMWSDVERADLSPVGPFTYWMAEDGGEEGAAQGSGADGRIRGGDGEGREFRIFDSGSEDDEDSDRALSEDSDRGY